VSGEAGADEARAYAGGGSERGRHAERLADAAPRVNLQPVDSRPVTVCPGRTMGKLSTEDSARLTALRFPLIVGVVYIHANNDRVGVPAPPGGPERVVHLVRMALSGELAAVAVPLFFLVAGFLFFVGAPLDRAAFGAKLRRRVRTLLVPYLLWNVALALTLALVYTLPAARGLLSGAQGQFIEAGPLAWADALLGVTRPPVAYQFWFIRDLMLVVLLAPLLDLVLRRAAWVGFIGFGVPWLTHAWPIAVPGAVGLTFFYVGAWLARRAGSPFVLDRWTAPLGVVYLALVAALVLGLTGAAFPYLHQVGIVLGGVVGLGATRLVLDRPRVDGALARLAASAFFVFAAHEPLLTLARRSLAKLSGPPGPALDLALYLVLPMVVIAVLVGLHRALRRVAPRFVDTLTGGR